MQAEKPVIRTCRMRVSAARMIAVSLPMPALMSRRI
jgi:hypothetical protein